MMHSGCQLARFKFRPAAADGSLFDPREVEPDNIRDPDARSVREALDAVTTKH
jgi:hypothetical protein